MDIIQALPWAAALLVAAWALPRIPIAVPCSASGNPTLFPPASAWFLVATLGLALGRLLFSLRNPPADWDSLNYHLPMVAHWIVSGTLGVPLRHPPAFGAYYPGSSEILQAFTALVLRRETLMTLPSIASLPLLALAVRRLALRAGARPLAAEVAAVALVATECAVRLTLGTRIDLSLALWAALTMVFLLEAVRSRSAGALALALLAGGLFAGSKASAPPVLVLMVVVFALGRWRDLAALLTAQRASIPAALVLGAYWYVRNLIATGNPLFPLRLAFGPLRLPGVDDGIDLARTTQIAVWREGYGGHLTPPHFVSNFGIVVLILALVGLVFWVAQLPASGKRDAGTRDIAFRLSLFALATFALFLASPFSGAYVQARNGGPPGLNLDNLRYLFPTLVAATAAGAAAIPTGLTGTAIALILALGVLPPLRPFAGHLVPGVIGAAVLMIAWRRFGVQRSAASAPAFAVVFVVAAGIGLAAAVVEQSRDRVCDIVWDGYLPRIHNLSAENVQRVREASAGARFSVVGMHALADYYGRDFSGRPVYVPLDRPWHEAASSWRFVPDARGAPDRRRWLENLRQSGARLVVIGMDSASAAGTPEWDWCAADTVAFTPFVLGGTDRAYRVHLTR